jgi:hypothetical protein
MVLAPKAIAKKLARAKHSSTPANTKSTHFKGAVLPKLSAKQNQLVAAKLRQRGESNNSEPLFMPKNKKPPPVNSQQPHTPYGI